MAHNRYQPNYKNTNQSSKYLHPQIKTYINKNIITITEKRMVRKFTKTFVLLILLLLVTSFFTFADLDTGLVCDTDIDCEIELGDSYESNQYYCEEFIGTCFTIDEEQNEINPFELATSNQTDNQNITTQTAPIIQQQSQTDLKINTNTNAITTIREDVRKLNNDLTNVRSQLQTIQDSINSGQQIATTNKVEIDNIKNDVSSSTTGLAALQQNLDTTEESLNELEQDITSKQRLYDLSLFIFVLLIAAGGVMYYMKRKKNTPAVNQEVLDYITSHIKKGNKFNHIKTNLLKAGWSENDIQRAYDETTKSNLEQYKIQKSNNKIKPQSKKIHPKHGKSAPQDLDHNKMKIISIVAISLLLLIGSFFALKETTGQAIHFRPGVVNETTNETIFECTLPHIEFDGRCCLDEDESGICDIEEQLNQERAEIDAEICNNHNDCSFGKACINSQCQVLEDTFKEQQAELEQCINQCSVSRVKVTTSDNEEYNVRIGRGSYTAAGGLEWKVLKGANFCLGTQTKIPIEFTAHGTDGILKKEIVLLAKEEISKRISHPTSSKVSFSVSIDDYTQDCS
jgi:hypothetical protein